MGFVVVPIDSPVVRTEAPNQRPPTRPANIDGVELTAGTNAPPPRSLRVRILSKCMPCLFSSANRVLNDESNPARGQDGGDTARNVSVRDASDDDMTPPPAPRPGMRKKVAVIKEQRSVELSAKSESNEDGPYNDDHPPKAPRQKPRQGKQLSRGYFQLIPKQTVAVLLTEAADVSDTTKKEESRHGDSRRPVVREIVKALSSYQDASGADKTLESFYTSKTDSSKTSNGASEESDE